MNKLLKPILKRTYALFITFAFGVAATMLWVYYLPDEELGSDRYDLVTVKDDFRNWWHQPHAFIVFVPPKYETKENVSYITPNCLTLVVSMDESKSIKLNSMNMGKLDDTGKLKETFAELFRQRLKNRAYRVGMGWRTDLPESDRIEKTVYIRAAQSLKYSEVIKLIDELKGAGANPIGIVTNDRLYELSLPPISSGNSTAR